jgi:AraC-like DNA-binding protein
VHAVEVGLDDMEVLAALRGDGAPVVEEEGLHLVVELDGARRPAAMVEHSGAEDETPHELGSLERHQKGDGRAVRVPEQVRGSADDLLEEGDRLVGHDVVGDRAVDVGRATVTTPVGAKHAEALREGGQVLLEGTRVREAGVQEDERLPVTVLLVVDVHVCELDIGGHVVETLRPARSHRGTLVVMLPSYREYRPPSGLEPVVACLWEHEPAVDHAQRVVPDGCVDLIWLAGRELVIAGADTGPRIVALLAGTRSAGIRLRPGAAGAILGQPASELRDHQVAAALVWGEPVAGLEEAMAGAEPTRRLELLADAVARRPVAPDPLVLHAARKLSVPGARVADVATDLGVGERQLHRRMLAAVGYGPKVLARVARLRRLVALADQSLASRALEAGYASQAHMTDEVRRLTGLTPVRFLEDAGLTAA